MIWIGYSITPPVFVQSLFSSTGFHYFRVLFVVWSKFCFFIVSTCKSAWCLCSSIGFWYFYLYVLWLVKSLLLFFSYESIDNVTTFAVFVWFNWVLIILLVWWWLRLKIASFIVEVSKSGWWYTVKCEIFLYSKKLLKKWAVFTLLN